MNYLELARETRDAAIESRDAKADELDAFASILDTEERKASDDEQPLVSLAVADLTARQAAVDEATAEVAKLEAVEASRAAAKPAQKRVKAVPADVDVRTAPVGEVRDVARKIIEESRWLPAARQEHLERQMFGNTGNYSADAVARRLVATERPAYRSAFMKSAMGSADTLTDVERQAVAEVRAMSNTTTAGGFGVPITIDPTVLITDGTGLLGILEHCRVENITNDAWKGVSAGNTAWSFDGEAAEVSDDTSTFAQPTVNAWKAQALVPYSIEIGEDYPGFAVEIGRVLRDCYEDLLAEKLIQGAGDGSNEPTGLFTGATSTVDLATDDTLAVADIDAVWAAVPEKFRARASWVMEVSTENKIRAFGSGTATSRFTVDQTAEGISLLNGKRVILSDYADDTTAIADAEDVLVVGDLSHFLVAQRVGMTVETVPHLFATANNLPSGQRGLYAYARVGSGVTAVNAFRRLKNITT